MDVVELKIPPMKVSGGCSLKERALGAAIRGGQGLARDIKRVLYFFNSLGLAWKSVGGA